MNAIAQLVEPVYLDHVHAIRCALSVSAAAMGHQVSEWQRKYKAGWRVSSAFGGDLTRNERFVQDCMTRLLLHSNLSREQWAVLVARFSPAMHHSGRSVADRHEVAEMSEALDCIMENLAHSVSTEFTGWCLLRWANRMPPGRGAWAEWDGRTAESQRTLHRRCADTYKALNETERAAKLRAIYLLKAAELIA